MGIEGETQAGSLSLDSHLVSLLTEISWHVGSDRIGPIAVFYDSTGASEHPRVHH